MTKYKVELRCFVIAGRNLTRTLSDIVFNHAVKRAFGSPSIVSKIFDTAEEAKAYVSGCDLRVTCDTYGFPKYSFPVIEITPEMYDENGELIDAVDYNDELFGFVVGFDTRVKIQKWIDDVYYAGDIECGD